MGVVCGLKGALTVLQNEAEIALALSKSGTPRKEIFITTKISPYQVGYPKGYDNIELSRLQA